MSCATYTVRSSANEARDILTKLDCFAPREIANICDANIAMTCDAISCHSAKLEIDAPLADLLKDADVLQHYLYNPAITLEHAHWMDLAAGQNRQPSDRIGTVLLHVSSLRASRN